jgi:hypothetical protein
LEQKAAADRDEVKPARPEDARANRQQRPDDADEEAGRSGHHEQTIHRRQVYEPRFA